MPPSAHTARYLTLFVAEGSEHLDALGRDLVELERDLSTQRVDSMFRHAHSVKGMAAAMGFDETARLAHRLEDLLGAIRSDLSRFDKAAGDLVLQAVDALLAHVRATSEGQPLADVSALVNELSGQMSRFAPSPPLVPPPKSSVPSAPSPPSVPNTNPTAPGPPGVPGASSTPTGTLAPAAGPTDSPGDRGSAASSSATGDLSLPPRYLIRLKVSPATAQPGVRGFLAFKRLSTLGNVFNLRPALDEVKAGRCPDGISLELETEESERQIQKTMQAVSEVELVSIAAISSAPPPIPVKAPESEVLRLVGQEPSRTVRVKAELLDHLLDMAGELLLATARVREVGRSLPEVFRPPLDDEVDSLHALVRGLHDRVMQSRMTPIGVITDRLPRAARDIARRMGREVEVSITGADIELDRAIVDELSDPLLHLLRNAIAHGLEGPEERAQKGKSPRGRVSVRVLRSHDRVVLEVEDDGRGIDVERLKALAVERGLLTDQDSKTLSERESLMLCCLPGLTTATSVTDISGRGVGMDAVKRAAESVGGSLEIETRLGRGTRFRLSVPFTVAMVNLLLVGVGAEIYGLPITKVSGVVETSRAGLTHSESEPVLTYGANVVPVHELCELLEVPGVHGPSEEPSPFVVVDADEGKVALAVDRLFGQEEVVLKALTRPLDLVHGLAGVTILGNGRPVFILDVARLFNG